jgi:hypothetical protein
VPTYLLTTQKQAAGQSSTVAFTTLQAGYHSIQAAREQYLVYVALTDRQTSMANMAAAQKSQVSLQDLKLA